MSQNLHITVCSAPLLAEALARVRAEFIEMPGLQLTLAQAARLWDLDRESCHTLLSTLVDAGFLVKTRNASFARA
jgi:DNA-binding IclR family transcriptional regulator